MNFSPLDLLSSSPWTHALFSTYSLSLSFFETVVLDALVRGRAARATIISDVEGVHAALHEAGAARVGKEYDLEPTAVIGNGVFHPKLTVLYDSSDCHVLLGSGNLTFGGWGGNLETIEHLHPSFASSAILDVARFFELLETSPRTRHAAGPICAEIAKHLKSKTRANQQHADMRVLHSLSGSILDGLLELVDGLGGAERLIVATPFWTDEAALKLVESFKLDKIYAHSHPTGSVEGFAGSNWPSRVSSKISPIELDFLKDGSNRKLHGKLFEICCKRGRVVMSGSANATLAAIDNGRNIEASLVRVERDQFSSFSYTTGRVPVPTPAAEDNSDEEKRRSGILQAAFDGGVIRALVVTPMMSGLVLVSSGPEVGKTELGQATVDRSGRFQIAVPHLDVGLWTTKRLIIEVRDSIGQTAQGFLSISAYAEMRRRTGPIATRLISILAGSETSSDIGIFLNWILENPDRLAVTGSAIKAADNEVENEFGNDEVEIPDLNKMQPLDVPKDSGENAGTKRNWNRLIAKLLSALREQRGPLQTIESEPDEPDPDEKPDGRDARKKRKAGKDGAKAIEIFQRLYDRLLSTGFVERHAFLALNLAQYICDRLRPDESIAKECIQKFLHAVSEIELDKDHAETVASLVLALNESRDDSKGARDSRRQLIRLGWDMTGPPPSIAEVGGFTTILGLGADFSDSWTSIQSIRTYQEQARIYENSVLSGVPSSQYDELLALAGNESTVLKGAISNSESRDRICFVTEATQACPLCHRAIPKGEYYALRETALATASNCCQRIIVCTGI